MRKVRRSKLDEGVAFAWAIEVAVGFAFITDQLRAFGRAEVGFAAGPIQAKAGGLRLSHADDFLPHKTQRLASMTAEVEFLCGLYENLYVLRV